MRSLRLSLPFTYLLGVRTIIKLERSIPYVLNIVVVLLGGKPVYKFEALSNEFIRIKCPRRRCVPLRPCLIGTILLQSTPNSDSHYPSILIIPFCDDVMFSGPCRLEYSFDGRYRRSSSPEDGVVLTPASLSL